MYLPPLRHSSPSTTPTAQLRSAWRSKKDLCFTWATWNSADSDNSLTAKLRNAWKIRPGEVYNAAYLSEYLPSAQKLLPPTLDWEVSPHVTANVRDKTVDVDLIYSAKAPK